MATVLLAAGTKGKRYALPNATIHEHPVWRQNLGGTAADVQIHARQMLNTENKVKRILAEHTGQAFEKVARDFERDYFMTPQEAIDYGIIDKIITKMPK